jgi:transketolase
MTAKFAKTYPGRAFNLGIAESNMIGVAAGLALSGVFPSPAPSPASWWAASRPSGYRWPIPGAVKLVGTHVGVAIGEDGYTQMGLEDIACIRSLPNIPIVQPADEMETKQAVAWAVEHQGPVYLRLTRQNLEAVHGDGITSSSAGRGASSRRGRERARQRRAPVECAGGGEAAGGRRDPAEVLNVATIKPLDEETILRSAGKTGRVVTVEDHSINGGWGAPWRSFSGRACPRRSSGWG